MLCFVDLGPRVQSPSGELRPLLPSAEPRVPGTGVIEDLSGRSNSTPRPTGRVIPGRFESLLSPRPLEAEEGRKTPLCPVANPRVP